jgi:hypothetical protein
MINKTQANMQRKTVCHDRLQKPQQMLLSPSLEDWVMQNRMNLTFHASVEALGPCYHKEDYEYIYEYDLRYFTKQMTSVGRFKRQRQQQLHYLRGEIDLERE